MPPWATSLFVPCDRFPEDQSYWDVGLLTRGLRSSPPLDAVVWTADRFPSPASTCAGAEAAGRTRLEPWVRLGSGDLAASLPACSLRSFWQWVLLAVKMPCYLGKLGRKSCFQVSPTRPVLSRCLTGSTVTPAPKHGLDHLKSAIMALHTHGCLYSERSRHVKEELRERRTEGSDQAPSAEALGLPAACRTRAGG